MAPTMENIKLLMCGIYIQPSTADTTEEPPITGRKLPAI